MVSSSPFASGDSAVRRLGAIWVSDAMLLLTDLGVDPMGRVFHQVVSRRLGLGRHLGGDRRCGGATDVDPAGPRPGFGSVSNVFVVGSGIDLVMAAAPDAARVAAARRDPSRRRRAERSGDGLVHRRRSRPRAQRRTEDRNGFPRTLYPRSAHGHRADRALTVGWVLGARLEPGRLSMRWPSARWFMCSSPLFAVRTRDPSEFP